VYYLEGDRIAYYRRTDGSAAINMGAGTSVISPDGKWILSYSRKSKKLMLQPVSVGEPKELPTPGLVFFDHASWSDDGRQIAYEGQTSQNEWNVYKQRIDGGPPALVKTKARNANPVLSADGALLALREEHGGIFLFKEGGQPTALKGTLPNEVPIRLANGGSSLLVAEIGGRAVELTLIDLSNGRRELWKRFPTGALTNGRPVVTTPDLKYYVYESPRYSSDLYLVENLR
jgi:hypothetical protein